MGLVPRDWSRRKLPQAVSSRKGKNQDKSLTQEQTTETKHQLSHLFTTVHSPTTQPEQSQHLPYRRFANRLSHHSGGSTKQQHEISLLIQSDPTIQAYYSYLRSIRGNSGHLAYSTSIETVQASRRFLTYTGLPLDNKSLSQLIEYKRNNPRSTEIEQAVRDFSLILSSKGSIKHSHTLASFILGIFKANYTPLQIRIHNHFPPAQENCTEGIFLQIYNAQDQETKDMLQWGQYCPERAKATYRVSLEQIDLSRKDYAIIWTTEQQSKTRTKHPMFAPIEFAKRIINNSKASGRTCPFPNHETLWNKLTTFARQEYKVRLVSNYLRKRYVDIAEQTTMPKTQAAFIMGDKTKIAQEGIHLDLIYGRGLRFVESLIHNFENSGLADALTITAPNKPSKQSKEQILKEIDRLNTLLAEQS